MRIAFITYEYPPDIAQGGIATYVAQAAQILYDRGHEIEIFCGSYTRTISENICGILIHRCIVNSPIDFQTKCVDFFAARHLAEPFDVIESPEIHANALKIKNKFPLLPLVVKLHMPLFLQMRLMNYYTSRFTRYRFFIGGIRRGRIRRYGHYDYSSDIDYEITKVADSIVSPSISLRNIIIKEWEIEHDKIDVIPYPFEPSTTLLKIPIKNKSYYSVTFIGKLNVHKGLINLIKVIPFVVKKNPNVLFTLIGNDSEFGAKKMLMSSYIKKKLKGYEKNYIIKGGLQYSDVIEELKHTTICIFPSIWENFPLVCMEAMSAGRAVIGSNQGGMSEMLSDEAGIIIDPLKVREMVDSINYLLANEEKREALGINARNKILKNYNSLVIGERLEKHYKKTIDIAKDKSISFS